MPLAAPSPNSDMTLPEPPMGSRRPVQNALTGGYASPTPLGGNPLTNYPGSAPSAVPQPPMVAQPSAVSVQPSPPESLSVQTAPAGQGNAVAIANAIRPDKLTSAELKERLNRFEYIRNAVGNLLQKPAITHDDVLNSLHEAVKDKAIPASEAGVILGGITTDPAKLRAEMQHRYLIAVGGLVHLAGEQQKRSESAQKSGERA